MLHFDGLNGDFVNSWYSNPPCLGSDAEFAAARRVFLEGAYTYATLCAFLGVERLYEYKMRPSAEQFAEPLENALAVINRLFCQGLHVHRGVVERILSPESRAALDALHLLDHEPNEPEIDFAPATVLPFLDALTVTDRFCIRSTGEAIEFPSDAVYRALYDTTYNFVTRLPQTHARICWIGNGHRHRRHLPVALRAPYLGDPDITPRAVDFAEFEPPPERVRQHHDSRGDLDAGAGVGVSQSASRAQLPYVVSAADTVTFWMVARTGFLSPPRSGRVAGILRLGGTLRRPVDGYGPGKVKL